MSLKNWEDNFTILLGTLEVNIMIQSTVSSITLPTAWELAEKVAGWSKIKTVDQGWNTVANPPYFDPSIFGHYITEYVDKLLASAAGHQSYLTGFATQIKSSPINKPMMIELRNFLDVLDKSRGQNWRAIYPWMDEIFKIEIGDSK
jgi:hypothetical protein